MPIRIIDKTRKQRKATTFIVGEAHRCTDRWTSAAYVSWIVYGLRDHSVPEEWIAHVIEVAIATNTQVHADNARAAEEIRLIKTL